MTVWVVRRDVICTATRRDVPAPGLGEEMCGWEGIVDLELSGREDDPSWLWECPMGHQHHGTSLDELP